MQDMQLRSDAKVTPVTDADRALAAVWPVTYCKSEQELGRPCMPFQFYAFDGGLPRRTGLGAE